MLRQQQLRGIHDHDQEMRVQRQGYVRGSCRRGIRALLLKLRSDSIGTEMALVARCFDEYALLVRRFREGGLDGAERQTQNDVLEDLSYARSGRCVLGSSLGADIGRARLAIYIRGCEVE
ncbi:hypothetical protein UP09_08775 [Bradyrhizobium sp. LTSP885]|nr:hypothetical protein UP09_08775 [Bradyrhizobium sp. LTSP885]